MFLFWPVLFARSFSSAKLPSENDVTCGHLGRFFRFAGSFGGIWLQDMKSMTAHHKCVTNTHQGECWRFLDLVRGTPGSNKKVVIVSVLSF